MNPLKRRDYPAAGSGGSSELRATLTLAAPLAAANLAQMAMGVTNTLMVGRLGALPLAAAGLGGMLYFTCGVILQGVLTAVAPLVAHALGAGDRHAAGRTAGAGLALAVLLAAPMIIGFAVLRSLLSALSRTRPVMMVVVLCVAGNAALNWVLIFGHLGAPALAVAGSGYASAINHWLMLAGLALCTRLMPGLAALRVARHSFPASPTEIVKILRLGAPIGGMRGIEVGVFMTAGVLMGLLGPAALGAHQLVLNCAGITFMVPLGLAQAAMVRVAYELGAARPVAARRAGFTALTLGVGFMGATALVLWTFPQTIIAAYVDTAEPANRELVQIARRLIAIAAIFQVFDGMQVIAAAALRGYKDTFVPMLLATVGYWGVGFAGGWLLAFPFGYGAVGLWWGLALGLATVAVLLTLRLHLLGLPVRQALPAAAQP
jgi:MATE family multidrug resistance protein